MYAPTKRVAATSGHYYLADSLKACGVSHFFHMPLLAPSTIKRMTQIGLQAVATHSEKAAAYMADGYARASGRIGVCGAQAIGAANLAAGLLDAMMAKSPVLAITGGGTPESRDRNFYQEVDQRPLYQGLVKFDARVETMSRLPDLLNQAMRVATTGAPGPAHLELINNIGYSLDGEVSSVHRPEPHFAAAPAIRSPADAEAVAAAAKRLAAAERPMVIAGSGIRVSRAWDQLKAFVEAWNLPLATSLDAKATLPDGHRLNVGVCGNYSRDTANKAVVEADFFLFVGSTTGNMTTSDWLVARPGVPTIQIDVDPRELGRNFPLEVALCGDPATVLDQLTALAQPKPRAEWLERIAEFKEEWRAFAEPAETSDKLPIQPQRLCRDLSEALPEGALLVVDTGHSGTWTARNIYLDKPSQQLLRTAGSLGWAYPAAIGAKAAQPDRPVVAFTGDGGFLYHLAEMETAMRYGISTVTVLNNNNAFSQEKPTWMEDDVYDENWRFSPVDYETVAKGFGCKVYHVEKPGEIVSAVRSAVAEKVPAIVEVISDPEITCPRAWRPQA